MDIVYIETSIVSHENAHVLPRVYQLLDDLGLPGMLIATPIEFLGGSGDDESNP